MESEIDMGLYDSDTGVSLEPEKVVDVSEWRAEPEKTLLLYTTAVKGRIVQLRMGGARIHYFFDTPGGQKMIEEDTKRFGFVPGELLALIVKHAPTPELSHDR